MSDESLVRYLLDQLDDEEVSARRMFGGHGIYRDGRMFALVYGGK
ncbi:MAG TPA: TfoX/Sxy family protein, partial [Actinomycetota bacterium]|nr:TfoX/Sxy family protein [Actinomycetota bacterium]